MAIQLDDIELIRSVQAGSTAAFELVVSQYREPLTRHAVRRLNDVTAAEDAVQETFFRAYRAFDRLNDDSRLGPWLHHILGNVCIDEANRRRRESDKSVRVGSDPCTNRSVTPGIEDQLGLHHDAARMLEALYELPSTHQAALTMRFVDELTYDEIATASGTSEENARARVSRARSAMRAALRGVAAIPVFAIGLVRRGSRSAAALDRAEQAHRATVAVEGAASVSKVATSLAPMIETANAVAMTAHQSAPILTKAAIGIGAVALATMSTGPERPVVPVAPVQAEASAAVDQVDDADRAPRVVAAAPAPAATPTPAPTPVDSVPPVAESAPLPPPPSLAVLPPLASDVDLPVAAEPETTTTAPPTTEPAPTAPPTTEKPVATAPPSTEPVVEEPPVETTPPVPALHGGSVSAGGISVTPSGPRLDIAGGVSLSVAGSTFSGNLSGRLAISADVDGSGRQRLEGTLTLQVDGGTVELRLAGHAVGLDGSDGVPATSFSLSGQFRATSGESIPLVGGGSFQGSFSPGSLSLSLS